VNQELQDGRQIYPGRFTVALTSSRAVRAHARPRRQDRFLSGGVRAFDGLHHLHVKLH